MKTHVPIFTLLHEADTSDFKENEIRSCAIIVNMDTWDKKIPVSEPQYYDMGIDKDKKWYRYFTDSKWYPI